MTFKDIEDRFPDWIKEVGSKKSFSLGVGYVGWDWDRIDGERRLAIKLNFYYPNGMKRQCDLTVASQIFLKDQIRLDVEANIDPTHFEYDDLIKLRFMYLIYRAYKWIEGTTAFNPAKSARYLNSVLKVLVNAGGYIDYKIEEKN